MEVSSSIMFETNETRADTCHQSCMRVGRTPCIAPCRASRFLYRVSCILLCLPSLYRVPAHARVYRVRSRRVGACRVT
jgi:hypothetical protein